MVPSPRQGKRSGPSHQTTDLLCGFRTWGGLPEVIPFTAHAGGLGKGGWRSRQGVHGVLPDCPTGVMPVPNAARLLHGPTIAAWAGLRASCRWRT